MRHYSSFLLLLALLIGAPAAFAQMASRPKISPMSRQLTDFVPPGYRIVRNGQATGDLNHDSHPDVALVLGSVAEDTIQSEDDLPARQLLVLFGTPTGYTLAAQSTKAVWCKACSGNGDPFDGLSIKQSILLIKHDTGGNWGHRQINKFRYQQGAFYLIGETQEYSRHAPDCDKLPYPPRYDYKESNFVTGEYDVIRTSDTCQLLEKKHGRGKHTPLIRLADYAVKM